MTEKTSEKGDSYKLNIKEISRVLTKLTQPRQNEENVKKIEEVCDIYGDFGSVDAVVHKDVYVIYGGIDNRYEKGQRLTDKEFREKFITPKSR